MKCEQELEVEIDGRLLVVWYDLADPEMWIAVDEDDNEIWETEYYSPIEDAIREDIEKRGSYEDYMEGRFIDEQIDKRRENGF